MLEQVATIVLDRLGAERRISPSPWLTAAEAADYIRSGVQRIYDLRSSGRLTRYRDGSRAMVSRDELDALLGEE
jgi:excisionase family DNA binding protein